jgi:peptidyl-prolyl cis-trans isomerase SurA
MKTRRSSLGTVALLLAIAAPAGHAQLRLPSAAPDAPGFGVPAAPSWSVPSGAPSAAPAGPRAVDRVVAIVNAEAITEGELAQRTRAVLRRLQSQPGSMPPAEELRRQVLERMILERAQVQSARDAGVRIDEVTVDRTIARIAEEAKLSVAQLRERLAAEGTSFATFRQEVTTELTVSRLREREVDARIQVSEAEIDAYLAEQAALPEAPPEYNIAQIVVRVAEGASADEVEGARERAEAIAAEARGGVPFERIAARLAETPEGVSGAITGGVLGMRPADRLPPLFVDAVAPLAAGQVAPVVRSPAGFHVLRLTDRRSGGPLKLAGVPVRQTRARHILVRINELNPEPEVVRRLTEIRQRIEGGTADFAEMARQYSVDGSASQGGDLGWVYPGDTVPEFERAMDGLAPSQIAGPVRSPFGYHLIQVVERRTDEASPDRLRAAARNALRERKVAEALQDWTAQIRDRAYVEYRLDER